nr:TOBE domain-containing protein [uncultured Arsenicicoccus sp.]
MTGSPRTVIPAVVTDLTTHAGAVRLWACTPSGVRIGADVTPLACAELGLRAGTAVTLAVKAQGVRILPAP